MSSPLLDELHWLTEALHAHVAWSRATGSHGLPACDEVWLDKRRDHYRKTELRPSDNDWLADSDERSDSTAATQDQPRPAAVSPSPRLQAPAHPSTPAQPPTPTQPRIPDATSPSPAVRSVKLATNSDEFALAGSPVKSVLTALGNGAAPSSTHARSTAPTPKPTRPATVNPISLNPAQKQARLVTLQAEVDSCTSCGLCKERQHPAFARGTGSSGIVFVGEGPGADEDAQGIPFVGAAGQLLDRMIAAMGLARDDVYVCNIIKCRPPNNRKPTDDEIAACRHFVVEQLQLIEPQVIVALGATAVEGLLGLKLGITRLRGTWRLYEGRIPVMPTFHPAYLLRKPDAKREVWEDLQAVLARVNRTLPPRS